MNIGQVCVKIAGRDAGNTCVIVEILDDTTALIDGGVRRRKCNLAHLHPLKEKIDIKKGASHADVAKIFKEKEWFVWETKAKKSKERPKKVRNREVICCRTHVRLLYLR